VIGYLRLRLVMDLSVNFGIQARFQHGHSDTTNAVKAYRREVIDEIQPLLPNHFSRDDYRRKAYSRRG
jgi:dolichol-phosphate mannosyltransferase